ncbi:glycosyltransferase [Enterococcus faecium]|nr:glycosyltransferase [Enterococcus faecium]
MSTVKKIKTKIDRQFDLVTNIQKNYENNNQGFKTVVDYTNLFLTEPIRPNEWLIESYEGKETSLSIIKLLPQVLKNAENVYLVSVNPEKNEKLLQQFPSLKFVKKGSAEYLKRLATAENILTDGIMPSLFICKEGQNLYNTVEVLFSRISTAALPIWEKQAQRTLLQSTHILSDASMFSKISSHLRVSGIYSGKVHLFSREVDERKVLSENTSSTIKLFFLSRSFWTRYTEELKKEINSLKTSFSLSKIFFAVDSHDYIELKKDPELSQFIVLNDYKIEDLVSRADEMYFDESELADSDLKIRFVKSISSPYSRFDNLNLNSLSWQKISAEKRNIIMYCGGFLNNGITSSAINLSKNLNYNKYNLIIIDKSNGNNEYRSNISKLDKRANIVFRTGQINVTKKEAFAHDFIISRRGMREPIKIFKPHKMYQREMVRILGNLKIDIAVDFSGYVPFWSAMMAFSTAARKAIFQHNDLYAETQKRVNGKFKHKYILPRVFSLYNYFDAVVSVSKKTMELNQKNLAKYSSSKKYFTVNNALDLKGIFEKACLDNVQSIDFNGDTYLFDSFNKDEFVMNMKLLPFVSESSFNFLTIGRMSPEKNHMKLFKAFEKVANQFPEKSIKLYVLGDGDLRDQLERYVIKKGLTEKILILGQVDNPFVYMNYCDCFVLASDHEGQPMVLLEALALRKEIVATDIVGNRSVLEGTYGRLCENNVDSLADEMIEVLKNKRDRSQLEFDIRKYNDTAMNMFYNVVCGE